MVWAKGAICMKMSLKRPKINQNDQQSGRKQHFDLMFNMSVYCSEEILKLAC